MLAKSHEIKSTNDKFLIKKNYHKIEKNISKRQKKLDEIIIKLYLNTDFDSKDNNSDRLTKN